MQVKVVQSVKQLTTKPASLGGGDKFKAGLVIRNGSKHI